MTDIRERVADALRSACREEFGTDWGIDVSRKFADAALSECGHAEMVEALEKLIAWEPVRCEFSPTEKGDLQFAAAVEEFNSARAALSKARGET